jgi:hypothetical protein
MSAPEGLDAEGESGIEARRSESWDSRREKSRILSETADSTWFLASDNVVSSAMMETKRFQLGTISEGMGMSGVLAAMSASEVRWSRQCWGSSMMAALRMEMC